MAHMEPYMEVCVHRSRGRTANLLKIASDTKPSHSRNEEAIACSGTRNRLNRLKVGRFPDLLPSILFVPKVHTSKEPVLPD